MNIPFSPPDISELEVAEVAEALRSGWASLRQGVCYGEGSTTSRYGNSNTLAQGSKRVSPRWQTQLHEGYAQYIDGDLFWGIWTLFFNLKTNDYCQRYLDVYGRDLVSEDALRTIAAIEVFG